MMCESHHSRMPCVLQDDVDMVPSSAVATQHEPGLMTESVKHLDKP